MGAGGIEIHPGQGAVGIDEFTVDPMQVEELFKQVEEAKKEAEEGSADDDDEDEDDSEKK